MWHEARKQEKKIRGMLVDYRRRAERRRDYYEKIVRTRKHAIHTYIAFSLRNLDLCVMLITFLRMTAIFFYF